MRAVTFAMLAMILAACGRQTPLAYQPTTRIATQSVPVVRQVKAVDQRGEADPTWIGAVRGGYGNPLKVLHTPKPLAEEVADAFRQALRARGFLASGSSGTVDLTVTIVAFSGTQVVRREAEVDLIVELAEAGSGLPIYRDQVKANPVQGSVLALDVGVFGSSDDLLALTQGAMNQAIDTALDKPGFAAALRSASAAGA